MRKAKLALLGIGIILALLGVWQLVSFIRGLTGDEYNIQASRQTVIKEIRSLNRLETAQFTIEKVIDAGTMSNRFEELLFGDRILLIAHGSVIAGVDLSKLNPSDVSINNGVLTISLPAPEILVTRLDPEMTRVYDRRTGVLSKGDKDLESQARSEAERIIREAACTGGILSEASQNAQRQLTVIFRGLNFSSVIFNMPEGTC